MDGNTIRNGGGNITSVTRTEQRMMDVDDVNSEVAAEQIEYQEKRHQHHLSDQYQQFLAKQQQQLIEKDKQQKLIEKKAQGLLIMVSVTS